MAFRAAPLSLSRIVPRVTKGRVTPFIPRERPKMPRHAIHGYLRLLRPTPCTDAGAALALLLSGGTRVRHWQSTRRLWPDTKRLQLPLRLQETSASEPRCRRQFASITLLFVTGSANKIPSRFIKHSGYWPSRDLLRK